MDQGSRLWDAYPIGFNRMENDVEPELSDEELLTAEITDEALEATASEGHAAFSLSFQPIYCRFC